MQEWFDSLGTDMDDIVRIIAVFVMFIVAFLGYSLTRFLLRRMAKGKFARTDRWLSNLLKHGVFRRLAYLTPLLIIAFSLPIILQPDSYFLNVFENIMLIIFALIIIGIVNGIANTLYDVWISYEGAKHVPIRGILQALQVAIYFTLGFVVLSILLDLDPIFFLGLLAGILGVIGYVFRDPILGLMASLALAANEMVQIGDWIEISTAGVDGNVRDITLTSIKVENWDRTVTTVSTYSLISGAFTNWQAMQRSGARRILSSFYVDSNSVKHITDEERKALQERFNQTLESDLGDELSLDTNLGVFRAHIKQYLTAHPLIREDLTITIRLGTLGDRGIPIEIYAFASETQRIGYFALYSAIFEYCLATLPEFGLRAYQAPAGYDLTHMSTPEQN